VFEFGSITEVPLTWPEKLHEVRLNDFGFILTSHDGRSLRFPLAYPVRAISLSAGSDSVLSIHKTPKDLWIRKTEVKTK
jgi:hypothetical protein